MYITPVCCFVEFWVHVYICVCKGQAQAGKYSVADPLWYFQSCFKADDIFQNTSMHLVLHYQYMFWTFIQHISVRPMLVLWLILLQSKSNLSKWNLPLCELAYVVSVIKGKASHATGGMAAGHGESVITHPSGVSNDGATGNVWKFEMLILTEWQEPVPGTIWQGKGDGR